jgi:hypothetical protein
VDSIPSVVDRVAGRGTVQGRLPWPGPTLPSQQLSVSAPFGRNGEHCPMMSVARQCMSPAVQSLPSPTGRTGTWERAPRTVGARSRRGSVPASLGFLVLRAVTTANGREKPVCPGAKVGRPAGLAQEKHGIYGMLHSRRRYFRGSSDAAIIKYHLCPAGP